MTKLPGLIKYQQNHPIYVEDKNKFPDQTPFGVIHGFSKIQLQDSSNLKENLSVALGENETNGEVIDKLIKYHL